MLLICSSWRRTAVHQLWKTKIWRKMLLVSCLLVDFLSDIRLLDFVISVGKGNWRVRYCSRSLWRLLIGFGCKTSQLVFDWLTFPVLCLIYDWQVTTLVRTSVFGWRTFPDLWLTCDHFVGKVSAVGQPTRPTQLFIPLWSVNECLHVLWVWRPLKWQTMVTYGSVATGQSR